MLVELKCEKFKEAIKNGISFNSGINFISSYDDESNSIGKTTFLSIIDYIYGGKAVNEKAAITKLESCEICYCMKFDKLYFYKADCKNRNIIYECDKNYNIIKQVKYDEYTQFLRDHIGVKINFSFRGAFSEFFRFFNKKEINITQPLSKNNRGVSPREDLNILLDLFDKYDQYYNIEIDLKDKKDTRAAVKMLEKSKSLSQIVIDKKQYEYNKEQLEKIASVLDDTYINNADMIINIATENDDFFEIKSEYNEIIDRIMEIDSMIESNNYTYDENAAVIDINRIKEFYGAIDFKKVNDLMKYHNDLKNVLQEDFTDTIATLNSEKKVLITRKNEIERDIRERGISKEALNNITKNIVAKLIKKQVMEDQNLLYEKIESLKIATKSVEAQLNHDKFNDLKIIEKSINDKLSDFCAKYYNGNVKPATFNIKTNSNYTMEYKEDDGSGCAHINLILFDLIVLISTKLPLLIHDSNLSSDIDAPKMKTLVKLYAESQKQIFVALSNCGKYDAETKDLISKYQILELGAGANRLFGDYVD